MQLMYENNLPLIKKFIKPYTAYKPTEDLLQESFFRLWEAVQRYLEKCGSTVRILPNARAKMTKCRRAMQQLEQEQGREPTAAEIVALMGVSEKEVQEIQVYMQGVESLDTPISDDDSLTLSDTLQADKYMQNTAKMNYGTL